MLPLTHFEREKFSLHASLTCFLAFPSTFASSADPNAQLIRGRSPRHGSSWPNSALLAAGLGFSSAELLDMDRPSLTTRSSNSRDVRSVRLQDPGSMKARAFPCLGSHSLSFLGGFHLLSFLHLRLSRFRAAAERATASSASPSPAARVIIHAACSLHHCHNFSLPSPARVARHERSASAESAQEMNGCVDSGDAVDDFMPSSATSWREMLSPMEELWARSRSNSTIAQIWPTLGLKLAHARMHIAHIMGKGG